MGNVKKGGAEMPPPPGPGSCFPPIWMKTGRSLAANFSNVAEKVKQFPSISRHRFSQFLCKTRISPKKKGLLNL